MTGTLAASAAAAVLTLGPLGLPPLAAQQLDRTDATATATAILVAYQARDLARLATLANASNGPLLRELAEQGERHPRYASIFRGWRWDAVAQWRSTIDDVRYRGPATALVLFGPLGPDEVAVVVLTWEASGWAFEDINSPSRDSYEALSRTRPRTP